MRKAEFLQYRSAKYGLRSFVGNSLRLELQIGKRGRHAFGLATERSPKSSLIRFESDAEKFPGLEYSLPLRVQKEDSKKACVEQKILNLTKSGQASRFFLFFRQI